MFGFWISRPPPPPQLKIGSLNAKAKLHTLKKLEGDARGVELKTPGLDLGLNLGLKLSQKLEVFRVFEDACFELLFVLAEGNKQNKNEALKMPKEWKIENTRLMMELFVITF